MKSYDTQNFIFFSLLCILSSFLIRFIFNKSNNQNTTLHLPPCPPPLPIIGHIHHLTSLALHKSFHNLSCKYGPLLYLRFGYYPCLLVSSSAMAGEIFKNQDVNFASRPTSPLNNSLIFGNDGFVTVPYGDYWRFMKKLSVTELHGARQIERPREVRRQEIERFLRKMIESAMKTEVVDIGAELTKVTNNVICRLVASTSCSEEDDEAKRIRELLKASVVMAGKMSLANLLGPLKELGFWLYANEEKKLRSSYNELLDKLLKEHEDKAKNINGRDYKDLLDILLEVYHDGSTEFKISREQMKSFIVDLIFSGTSTSAETIQWTMAELINHPTIYKIARDEIETVVGRNRLVEETDISSLHYLQAIVKETLRLHPNAPFAPRVCLKHCKINGFDIPENTPVAVNLYSIMRDPEIWENPNEFRPVRFLGPFKNETKAQNFDYVPFGGGRRGCPGKNLANILMNTTIASIIQCLDLKVAGEDEDVAKVNMQAAIGMSLNMANPLKCIPLVHSAPFC